MENDLKEAAYELERKYLHPVKIWAITFFITMLVSPIAIIIKEFSLFVWLLITGFIGTIGALAYYVSLAIQLRKGIFDYKHKTKKND